MLQCDLYRWSTFCTAVLGLNSAYEYRKTLEPSVEAQASTQEVEVEVMRLREAALAATSWREFVAHLYGKFSDARMEREHTSATSQIRVDGDADMLNATVRDLTLLQLLSDAEWQEGQSLDHTITARWGM